MLNELSQTDEGVNVISNLINQFKERTQMFEQGGKLSFLVEKLKNGNKYNRQQARQNKEDAGLYYTDENTGQRLRGPIDKGNLKAKTAKAKAVDGYQDQEFITDFNRKDYRARKQALKQTNPELSRRERKAEALLAHPATKPTINPGNVGEIGYQKIVFNKPRNGVVEVGNITSEVIPNPIERPTTIKPTIDPVSKPVDTEMPSTNNRLNWNEFANAIETKLRNSGSFRAGMDYATLQALMEDEYRNYYNNPDTYKFDSMTAPVFDRYRNRRLTMPAPIYRAGYGDFDTDRSYLFNDGDLGAVPTSPKYEAMSKGISYPIMGLTAATAAAPVIIQGARDAIGYAGQMLKNAQTSGYYPRQVVQRPSNPARVRLPNGRYTQRPAQELYRGPGGRYVAPYQVPNFFFKKGGEISKFDNGGKQENPDMRTVGQKPFTDYIFSPFPSRFSQFGEQMTTYQPYFKNEVRSRVQYPRKSLGYAEQIISYDPSTGNPIDTTYINKHYTNDFPLVESKIHSKK